MSRHPLLAIVLALSSVALAACGDETSQPNPATEAQATVPELAVAPNTWLTRADMWGTERWDLATAVVPNAAGQSVLYAIGGRTATGGTLSRVMGYNAATNSWTLRTPLPVPLKETNGAGVIDGKIYVSGGLVQGDKGYSSGLFVYDPATDTWATKRFMPTLGLNGVTGVIDGRLYVVTSCQDSDWCGSPYKWLLRYDPLADTWTELATPLADIWYRQRLVGGTINKKLYVGVPGSKTLYVYNPLTDTWAPRATTVAVRAGAASATLGAKLYMIGGSRWNADGTATEVRATNVYDPGTNTWTTKAPLPTLRSAASADRVFVDGRARIEVVGGSRPGNNLQYVP
jgi:N-acetylneuraminic acid mutarotase